MTDCLFLLADANMESMFNGFLGRQNFYESLECGKFSWKTRHSQGDPYLFRKAPVILRAQKDAERAVVVLDAEWDGSPGAPDIASDLTQRLLATGWQKDAVQVIVIDP